MASFGQALPELNKPGKIAAMNKKTICQLVSATGEAGQDHNCAKKFAKVYAILFALRLKDE